MPLGAGWIFDLCLKDQEPCLEEGCAVRSRVHQRGVHITGRHIDAIGIRVQQGFEDEGVGAGGISFECRLPAALAERTPAGVQAFHDLIDVPLACKHLRGLMDAIAGHGSNERMWRELPIDFPDSGGFVCW